MENKGNKLNNSMQIKSIIVLFSYHHKNTEKIAKVFAEVLNAEIRMPEEINPEELQDYDLVGFGSGIYSAKNHESLLELADELSHVTKKNAFIFSTSGITGKSKAAKDHSKLREKLQSKGYIIVDEFQCKGFNTNSFLRLFGGMNKGRPNPQDLKNAEDFAQKLKQNKSSS
jgi:flavodoxin